MRCVIVKCRILECKYSLYNFSRKFCQDGEASRNRLKIIFFGTDKFSLESLKRLVSNAKLPNSNSSRFVNSLHIVTKEASLVSKFAQSEKLPFTIWPDSRLTETFDVGIIVSFGHLLKSEDINRCHHGILNVHGSLLPRWRGASPIHHAILAGDEITGVTVMQIRPEKFDIGDIIATREYRVPYRATTPIVYKDLSTLGADLLVEVLSSLPQYLKKAVPQPQEGVTIASKPKSSDGVIVFEKITAQEVDRKVRALEGLVDVYTLWINGLSLKLFEPIDPDVLEEARIDELIAEEEVAPGSIFYHRKRRLLCFKCKDRWLAFPSVALKGYKRMTALAFFNGFVNPLIKNNCQPKVIKTPRILQTIKVK